MTLLKYQSFVRKKQVTLLYMRFQNSPGFYLIYVTFYILYINLIEQYTVGYRNFNNIPF